MVEKILAEDGKVKGVLTSLGILYGARAVIVTTGTFLKGLIHIGLETFRRAGQENSLQSACRIRLEILASTSAGSRQALRRGSMPGASTF